MVVVDRGSGNRMGKVKKTRSKSKWAKRCQHPDDLDKQLPSRKYAWEQFSRYIRTRDCLRTTGTLMLGKCITCGREYDIDHLQAGHLVPGRHDAVLFDEVGVQSQCKRCNVFRSGEWPAFYLAIEERYGHQAIVEIMKRYFDHSINFSPEEYRVIGDKYKARLALLRIKR